MGKANIHCGICDTDMELTLPEGLVPKFCPLCANCLEDRNEQAEKGS